MSKAFSGIDNCQNSIFLARLWFVRTRSDFKYKNPEISEFLTANAYKYKSKQQVKMKRRENEILKFEKHSSARRP